jgi:prophage antirepressor-like protein
MLIRTEVFGKVHCDFYRDGNGDIWLTRNQIGEALEYRNPNDAIKDIHLRHQERLDKFSRVVQIALPSGGKQKTYLYMFKGLYEICRWSQQPKADSFIDWAWDVIENIRTGNIKELATKIVRRELTDALRDSGLNEQMHGHGYENFTNLFYRMLTGMDAKKLREAMGLPPGTNLRPYLNEFQKQEIAKLEAATKGLIGIGMNYQEVKQVLSDKYLKQLTAN